MEDEKKQHKGGSSDIDCLYENMEDSNSNSYPTEMCDPEMDSNNESADQLEEDGNKIFDLYGDLDLSGDLQQGSSHSETDKDTTIENAVNDLDLYDEILTEEDAQQKQSYEEKCRQYELARQQIEKLEAENRKLKEDLSKQTLVSKNVQKNMSSLIVTARGEISRKDREINDLRKRHNFPRGNSYRNPGHQTVENRSSKSINTVGHPSTGKREDSGSDVSDSFFSRSKEATTEGRSDKKLDSNCVTNDTPTHSNRHHKETCSKNQNIDVFGRSRLKDTDNESDKEYYKDRDRRNKRDSVRDNNSKSSEKRKSPKHSKEVPVNGRLRTEFRNENKLERESEKKMCVVESKGHIRRCDKQESRKELLSNEKRRDAITNDKRTANLSETKDPKQKLERQIKVHNVQSVSNENHLRTLDRGDRGKDTLLDSKTKKNESSKDELKSSDRKDGNKRCDKKKHEESTRKPETEIGGKTDTKIGVEKNKMHNYVKSAHTEHKHDVNHTHSNQRKETVPDKTQKANKTSALKVVDLREKLKQKRALTESVSSIESDLIKIPTEKYSIFESAKQNQKESDQNAGLKQLSKPNITVKSNGNVDIGTKDTEMLKDREFLESLKSGVRQNKSQNITQDSKCADQPHRRATVIANTSDKVLNLEPSCERTIVDRDDLHSERVSSLENPALNDKLVERGFSHKIEKSEITSDVTSFLASQEDIVIDFGFQDDKLESETKESISEGDSMITQRPRSQGLLELDPNDNENGLDTAKHLSSVENIENLKNNDDIQTENVQITDKINPLDPVMHDSINVQSNTGTSSLAAENPPCEISVINEKARKIERRRSSEKKRRKSFRGVKSETISTVTSVDISSSVEDFVRNLRRESENAGDELRDTKSRKTFCCKEGCQIKVSHLHPKSEQNLTIPISMSHDTVQTEGKESEEPRIENIKDQDNQNICDSDSSKSEAGKMNPKENLSNQSTNSSGEMMTVEMNPKSNTCEENGERDKLDVKLNQQENTKQSFENDSVPGHIADELPVKESNGKGNEIIHNETSKSDLNKELADENAPSLKPSDHNTRDESSDSDEDSDYTGTGSGSSYSSSDSSDGEGSRGSKSSWSGSNYSSYGSCDSDSSDSEEPLTNDLNIKSNCSFESAPIKVSVEKNDSDKTLDMKTESSKEKMSPVGSDTISQSSQCLRREENITSTCDVSHANEQFTGLKQKDTDVIQEVSVTIKLADEPETTKLSSNPDKDVTTLSNPDKKIISEADRSSQLNKISPIRSIKERSFLLDSLLCGIKSVVNQKKEDEKRLSQLFSKVETAKETHANNNKISEQSMIEGHHLQKEEDLVEQFSKAQNHSNKRVLGNTADAKRSGDSGKMCKSTSSDARDKHSLKDDVTMNDKELLDKNSHQKQCSDVNVNVMKEINFNVKDTMERKTASGQDKDAGESQGDQALETSIFGSTLSLSSDDSAFSDSESCSGSSSGSYSSSGSSSSCSTCDSSDSESIPDATENQHGDSASKVSITETKLSNPDISQIKPNDISNEMDVFSDNGYPKAHESVLHNNTSGKECDILKSCAPVLSDENKHSRLEEIHAQVTSYTSDKQSDVLDICPSVTNHNSNELESRSENIPKKNEDGSTHSKADKPCKRNKADRSSKGTAEGKSSHTVISKDLPIGKNNTSLVPGSEYLIEDEMPKFLSDTLELKKLTNNKKKMSKSGTQLRPPLSSTSTTSYSKRKPDLDEFTNKTKKTEEEKGLDPNTLTTVNGEKDSTKIDHSAGNSIKSHKGNTRCKEKTPLTKDSPETKKKALEDEISKSSILQNKADSLFKNSKECHPFENNDKQSKSHGKNRASKSSTKKCAILTTSPRGKGSSSNVSKKILSTEKIKPQSKCHVKASRSDNSVSGSILRLVSKSHENIKEKSDRKKNEKAKLASPKKRLTKSLSKDNTSDRPNAANVSKYAGKKGTRLKFEHEALPELRDPASELTASMARITEYNDRVQERKKSLGKTNTINQKNSFPLSSNLVKKKSAKSKAVISSDTETSDEEQSTKVKDFFRIKKKSQQEDDQIRQRVVSIDSEKHIHESKQDEKKWLRDSIAISNSASSLHQRKLDKTNSTGTNKTETQSFECALENYESHTVKSKKKSKLKRDVTDRKSLNEQSSKTSTKRSEAPSELVSDISNNKLSSSVKKPNIYDLPEMTNLSTVKDRRENTLSCKPNGNIAKEKCLQTGVKKTKSDTIGVESKTALKEDYCNDDANAKFSSDSERDSRTPTSESDSEENIVKAIFGSSGSSSGIRKKSSGSGIRSEHVETNTIEMEKTSEVIMNLDEKLKQLYSTGRQISESDRNSRAKPIISQKQPTTSDANDSRPPVVTCGQKKSLSARKSSSKKSLETNIFGSNETIKVKDSINENKRKLTETNQTTKSEFTRKIPTTKGTKSISTHKNVQISSSEETNHRQLSDQISRDKPTVGVLEVKQTDLNTHTKNVPVLKSVSPKENVNKGKAFHTGGKVVELGSHKKFTKGKSVTDYILDDAEVFDAVDYDDDLSLCLDESGRSNSEKDVDTGDGNLHKDVDTVQVGGKAATPGSYDHSSEEGELSSDYDTDRDNVRVERKVRGFGSAANTSKATEKDDSRLGGNEKRSFIPIKFPCSTGQSNSRYVNNEDECCSCANMNCVHRRGSEVKRKRIQTESDTGDEDTGPAYSSAKKSHHEGKGRNISHTRKAIAMNSPVIRRHRSRSRSPMVKRHRRSRSPKHHISRRSSSISPRRHSKSVKSGLVSRSSFGSKRRRSISHERIRENDRLRKDRPINERHDKRNMIISASSSDDNDDRYRSPIRGSGTKRHRRHIRRRSDSRNRRHHSPRDSSSHRRDHSTRREDSNSETLHVSSKHSSKRYSHGSSSQKKLVSRKEKHETLSRKDISLYKRARDNKRFSGSKRKYASSSSDEYVLVKKSELKRRKSVRSITPTFSDSGDCTDEDENATSKAQRKNSSEKENYSVPLRKRQLTSVHE